MANSFDFLVALDDAVRASSHATVTNAQQMLGIARDARLSQDADTPRTDQVHDDTGDVPADAAAERQADQRGRDLLIDPDR